MWPAAWKDTLKPPQLAAGSVSLSSDEALAILQPTLRAYRPQANLVLAPRDREGVSWIAPAATRRLCTRPPSLCPALVSVPGSLPAWLLLRFLLAPAHAASLPAPRPRWDGSGQCGLSGRGPTCSHRPAQGLPACPVRPAPRPELAGVLAEGAEGPHEGSRAVPGWRRRTPGRLRPRSGP